MTPDPTPTDPNLRRRYLGARHGAANVAYLLLMHGLLGAWLWLGYAAVPPVAFAGLSVLGCLVHQRMLSEWFHEATHWNLLPDRRWNDHVADLLIGSFNGTRVRTNRPGHFRHHAARLFLRGDDPDTSSVVAPDRRTLVRGLALDLCGASALGAFLASLRAADGTGPRDWPWLGWLVTLHGAGLAITIAAGRPAAYPLYFLTLLCIYPVANRLRLYAQHAHVLPTGAISLRDSPASRTFHAGLVEQVLLHSPMIMYHHEHHAWPGLPYRALAAISRPSEDPNRFGASGLVFVARAIGGVGSRP